MGSAIIPLLVVIVGLVMYCVCASPKLSEVGRLLFFAGAFVCTWVLSRVVVHLP
jgi:hypothetical protein